MFERPKKWSSDWDTKDFVRKTDNCACGNYSRETNSTPWNVYVHTTNPDTKKLKTCTGTVINSNTVVTSHKCLLLGGNWNDLKNRMRVVDLFKFKHGVTSIARAEHVNVTRTTTIEAADDVGDKFDVLDIWYNPYFAISSESKRYPENDMVLIKVSGNFLLHDFSPICVPFSRADFEGKLEGFFYGFVESDNATMLSNYHPPIVEGNTLSNSDCSDFVKRRVKQIGSYAKNELLVKTTRCFEFPDDGNKNAIGGPLVVTPSDAEDTAFLFGIVTDIADARSQTGRDVSMGKELVFFSSIYPLVKFIEYFAETAAGDSGGKSIWCNTPDIDLKKDTGGFRQLMRWPWDNLSKLEARNESLDCQCGIQNKKMDGRIVGGVEATPREFGWMAAIDLYLKGKGTSRSHHICGGTIINDRVILTAAHCVVLEDGIRSDDEKVVIDPEDVDVILNAHLRNNDPEAIKVEVASVLFHPGYLLARRSENDYFDMDIALLVLKESLNFNPTKPGLRPICLSKVGEKKEVLGKKAWAVGWGLIDPLNDRSVSPKLQKIELPIIDLNKCIEVSPYRVTDNFLCAGTLDRNMDAAKGDSGGPLQMEIKGTESSQWYEVGAVSWGGDRTINGVVRTAALYADVQKLAPFIDYHSTRVQAQWCKE